MLHIHKASAGSGKTFALARQYLTMLLGHKRPDGTWALRRNGSTHAHRHILAITFTNKATEEMKHRIVHELAVLARCEPGWTDPSPYIQYLRDTFGCSDDQLAASARAALRSLLYDYGFFQVSTIDSFFQSVLRTFAREAELTGNYEVDLDPSQALEQGLSELFSSLKTQPESHTRHLRHWLTMHLRQVMDSSGAPSIFNRQDKQFRSLISFAKTTSKEEYQQHAEEMDAFLADPANLTRFLSALQRREDARIDRSIALTRQALHIADTRGYIEGYKIKSKQVKLDRYIISLYQQASVDPTKSLTAAQVNRLKTRGFYSTALTAMLGQTPDLQLEEAMAAAADALLEVHFMGIADKHMRRHAYLMGLLSEINTHVRQWREHNNTLLLGDTGQILRKIIGPSDTPFVYERTGIWLEHFLIDEFQDTSVLQYENLLPLLREGQSGINDSLIIGDEKQSIYRFRSSDPNLLGSRVEHDFSGKTELHGHIPAENTNWRSAPTVVRFNNAVFKSLAQSGLSDDITRIYHNVEQSLPPHLSPDDNRGYVELQQLISPTAITADYQQAALQILTRTIRLQLRAGYRPDQIAILVRKGKEATRVLQHLEPMLGAADDPDFYNVRIVTDESGLLRDSAAVTLIVSALRYLAFPDENPGTESKCRRAISRRQLARMVNAFQYHITLHPDQPAQSIAKAIADSQPQNTWSPIQPGERSEVFTLPSLVEQIVSSIPRDDMHTQAMYVSSFQDIVSDYCSRFPADIASFLQWWDTNSDTLCVKGPDDPQALRLMTIHKSKGLEWPCVNIPFLSNKIVEFKSIEWLPPCGCDDLGVKLPQLWPIEPDVWMLDTPYCEQYMRMASEALLDGLNLMYVAMTRAADWLSVTWWGADDTRPVPTTSSDLLSRALAHMAEHPSTPAIDQEVSELVIEPTTQYHPDEIPKVECITTLSGLPTTPRHTTHRRHALEPDPALTYTMGAYRTYRAHAILDKLRIDSNPESTSPQRANGILIHDILSRVHTPGSIPKAVATALHRHHMPLTQAPGYIHTITTLVTQPDALRWFDPTRHTYHCAERPVAIPNPTNHTVKTLRPDRLVWYADGSVDVIDYKTGHPNLTNHRQQVKEYMQLIRDMGHKCVRGYIWYTDTPGGQIVEVY